MIRTITPVSDAAQYLAGKNVTWKLSIAEQELLQGSIRITGDLVMTVTGGNTLEIDKLVGVHALFDNWVCGSEKKGNMEPVNNYGRFVRHLHVANLAEDDLGINRDGELMFHTDNALVWYQAQSDGVKNYISFCFKPLIPFNRSKGNISYDACGNLEIQHILKPILQALKSNDATQTLGYTIQNLKMHYVTLPDSKQNQRIMMSTYHSSQQEIGSDNVTISKTTLGSMAVDSVCASFISIANEGLQTTNYYAFEDMGVSSVQFSYNDIANNYFQFPMKTKEEIIYNGLLAFNRNNMKKYNMNALKYNNGENCIIGLQYPQLLDMTSHKFGVNILSNASNVNKYYMYLFFSGEIVY